MARLALLFGAINGFLAVALGAFGAHGLQKATFLGEGAERAKRLEWWATAGDYQMWHALLLVGVAALALRLGEEKSLKVATWATTVGILLFSGSLYVMTLTGIKVLGAVTPFGGMSMLVGWGAVLWASRKI